MVKSCKPPLLMAFGSYGLKIVRILCQAWKYFFYTTYKLHESGKKCSVVVTVQLHNMPVLKCLVCCQQPRTHLILPCEHLVVCGNCVTRLQYCPGPHCGRHVTSWQRFDLDPYSIQLKM